MISYALISPVNDLDLCQEYDYHMALAWACKNNGYKNFYKECSKQGDFVILDNGANEGNLIKGQEYIDIANHIRPSEIIAPDVFLDCDATIKETNSFLKNDLQKLDRDLIGINVMAVPQGKTDEDYRACWDYFATKQGIDTIGLGYRCVYTAFEKQMKRHSIEFWEHPDDMNIPNAKYLYNHMDKECFYYMVSRLYFLKHKQDIGTWKNKKVHLLGLTNPIELSFFKASLSKLEYNAIRSCDSASPIQAAQSYINFHKFYGLYEKPQPMLNMFDTLGAGQRQIAEGNINLINKWIR